MRVVDTRHFKTINKPDKKKTKRFRRYSIVSALVIVVVMFSIIVAPMKKIEPTLLPLKSTTYEQASISWPPNSQSAIGAVGYGVLGSNGTQTQKPIASVAKVMVALAVLQKKPLKLGESGPVLTIDEDDVRYYNQVVLNDGSNTPVIAGEQITQYEALQALLLPSSNNIAYTLAKWAFGSEKQYSVFANNFAKTLGMTKSNFADASGFSPQTVSTAEDLTRLAINAMDTPVIAEISGLQSATIPVAGTIYNVNRLLGANNIVGIKTGNTDEAGGCFMAAAKKKINGQDVVAVSVVLGSTHLGEALRDSVPLANSVLKGFKEETLVKKGQKVAKFNLPSGSSVDVVSESDLNILRWSENPFTPSIKVQSIDPNTSSVSKNTKVGVATVDFGRDRSQVNLIVTDSIASPNIIQRLKYRIM